MISFLILAICFTYFFYIDLFKKTSIYNTNITLIVIFIFIIGIFIESGIVDFIMSIIGFYAFYLVSEEKITLKNPTLLIYNIDNASVINLINSIADTDKNYELIQENNYFALKIENHMLRKKFIKLFKSNMKKISTTTTGKKFFINKDTILSFVLSILFYSASFYKIYKILFNQYHP